MPHFSYELKKALFTDAEYIFNSEDISGKLHVWDFIEESGIYENKPFVHNDKGVDVVVFRCINIIRKNKSK
jgi:hypothetical protein